MKQFTLTPSMGKRLIGRALAADQRVCAAAQRATLVIIAGTTNGYVAEELLRELGEGEGFTRAGFRRGVVTPPGQAPAPGKLAGDVVISGGTWLRGKTIFDVADGLKAGDVILKGANALDLQLGRAAVQIADPNGGTIAAALRAVIGRRVQLIIPVGLEKRVADDLDDLAAAVNAPDASGPRLWPMPGEVYTELDAIAALTGAPAWLLPAAYAAPKGRSAWPSAEAIRSSPRQRNSSSPSPPSRRVRREERAPTQRHRETEKSSCHRGNRVSGGKTPHGSLPWMPRAIWSGRASRENEAPPSIPLLTLWLNLFSKSPCRTIFRGAWRRRACSSAAWPR